MGPMANKYEKILNVMRNGNQTIMTNHLTPTSMAVIKKKQRRTNVGKEVMKSKPSSIADGSIKWGSCCGKESGSSSKS